MKLLMSAAGAPAAPTIIKHLKNLGHGVWGMDADPEVKPLAEYFCDEFYLAPRGDDPNFIDFLLDMLPRVDAYLPYVDGEILAVCNSLDQLPRALLNKILISDPETCLICLDKSRFQDHAEQLGLPVASRTQQTPAIYKPNRGRGSRGVVQIKDQALLGYYLDQPGVVQTYIEGQEYTIDLAFDQTGELLAMVPRKRLRASALSLVGETVQHPKLVAFVRRFIGEGNFNFRYGINLQLMESIAGEFKVIEINPRPAGSVMFSVMSGCDFFSLIIGAYTGAEPGVATEFTPRKIYRYWTEYSEAHTESHVLSQV